MNVSILNIGQVSIEWPEGFEMRTFKFLQYVSTNWPILSDNLHFCQIRFGSTYPHMTLLRSKGIVSTVWGNTFLKKCFSQQMGKQTFWANLWGGCCSTWGINDQIMPRMEEFHKCFSSNLNTVNLKVFPNHGWIYTWRWNPDQSIELWRDLSLRLIVKSFQRLCNI